MVVVVAVVVEVVVEAVVDAAPVATRRYLESNASPMMTLIEGLGP